MPAICGGALDVAARQVEDAPSSDGLRATIPGGEILGGACTMMATHPKHSPGSPVTVCHAEARCIAKPSACCSSRAGPQKLRLRATVTPIGGVTQLSCETEA